ncbi:hypothetical protein HK100_006340, partial [Physocladia obscura]
MDQKPPLNGFTENGADTCVGKSCRFSSKRIVVLDNRRRCIGTCHLVAFVLFVLFVVPFMFREFGFGFSTVRKTGSEHISAALFDSLAVTSSGAADVPVTISGTSGPDAIILYIIETNDRETEAEITISTDTTTTPNTLSVTILSPRSVPRNSRARVIVDIALPHDQLAAFKISADIGSFTYAKSAPDVKNSFKTGDIHVGSVHINAPLTTRLIDISAIVGSVNFDASITGTADLIVNSNTGSISFASSAFVSVDSSVVLSSSTGSIRVESVMSGAFEKLNIDARTGSVNLKEVSPLNEAVVTRIDARTGSVRADFRGFKGQYSAVTRVGSVRVSGHDVHSGAGGKGSSKGWVGDIGLGKGVVDVSSNV